MDLPAATEIVVYAASTIALAVSALVTRRASVAHDIASRAEKVVNSLLPASEDGKRLPIVRVPCPQHTDLASVVSKNRRDLKALKRGQNEILEYLTAGNGSRRRFHEDVDDTGRFSAVD